jgi:hypothetical protein
LATDLYTVEALIDISPVMIKEVLDWIEVNNIEEKQHKKIAQSK